MSLSRPAGGVGRCACLRLALVAGSACTVDPGDVAETGGGSTGSPIATGGSSTSAPAETGDVTTGTTDENGDSTTGEDSSRDCLDGSADPPAQCGGARSSAAVEIVAGGSHTCARLDTGAVRCWGDSSYGQLGYANRNTIGDNETAES